MRDNVDTLLVINNDKLIEVFGDLTLSQAFGKANEVLNTATKGIAEVISQTLMVNIDLNDAKRVLKNSGTAVMGQAYASGENRAIEAVEAALDSPLLNDNNIKGAQQVLLKIVTGTEEQEIRMTELFSIKKHIQDDGGLAYSNEGTQRRYLGPTVSKGKKYIGDLHGTKLFTWAIVLTSFILGWNKKLNYNCLLYTSPSPRD